MDKIRPIDAIQMGTLTALTYALPNQLKLHLALTEDFKLIFNHIELPDGRVLFTDALPDIEENAWMTDEGNDHSYALKWFNWVNEHGAYVHSRAKHPDNEEMV